MTPDVLPVPLTFIQSNDSKYNIIYTDIHNISLWQPYLTWLKGSNTFFWQKRPIPTLSDLKQIHFFSSSGYCKKT